MGYESRIYIITKTSVYHPDIGKKFAQKIACFTMSKCPVLSNKLKHKPATDTYIFADDGNSYLLEDNYGEPLTEASISEVIKILEDTLETGDTYRRLYPLLAALKALDEHKDQWDNLAVLHYGY